MKKKWLILIGVVVLVILVVIWVYSMNYKTECSSLDPLFCEVDNDCMCTQDNGCFMGNKEYYEKCVDKSGLCQDFCRGFSGHLNLKCINNTCKKLIANPVSGTPELLLKERALESANEELRGRCGVVFDNIEKQDWSLEGPASEIFPGICPGIEDYNSDKIWKAYKATVSCTPEGRCSTSQYLVTVLVGLNGEFTCEYVQDLSAAPGIVPLDEVCKSVTITTDKTEYEQGEIVNITVENGLDENICFESCNTCYFEREEDDRWNRIIEKLCESNFIIECIESGETKIFEKGISGTVYNKTGSYRITVPIYSSCQNEKFPCEKRETVYSNEFEIK